MATNRFAGPWTFRQGLLVLIGFLLLYALLNVIHMQIVAHTIGFSAYLGRGQTQPSPWFLLFSQLIKAMALLAAIWWLALKRLRLSWQVLGWRRCERRWLAWAVILAIAGFALRLLLSKYWITVLPGWAKFLHSLYVWRTDQLLATVSLMVMTIVITPIAEEVFFRGFLFQWMATHRPLWVAMLFSSLIFGASHIVPPQMISAALMSLLIVWLYWRSQSLWPSIVCHVLNNAFGVVLGMLQTN